MKTTKATKQTAAACYAERHTECQDLLKRIASRLEQHKKDQGQEPADCIGVKIRIDRLEDLQLD
jgi:hypothetical protein